MPEKETTAAQSSVSTTTDPPESVLLRVRNTADGFLVNDFVGLRYGVGKTVSEAVAMWAGDVDWLLVESSARLAHPILGEQQAYRRALLTPGNAKRSHPETEVGSPDTEDSK
jgi:hypothetical protein